MILLAALALALLSVPLTGGRLGALATLPLRGQSLLAAAMGLQILVVNILPTALAPPLLAGLHLVSYALAAGALLLNLRRLRGLWLVAVGGAMNAAAIVANAGVMPAAPAALRAAGLHPAAGAFVNSGPVASPNLWWLGDVFAWPSPLPLANVFSVGDLLLVAGFATILHLGAHRPMTGAARASTP